MMNKYLITIEELLNDDETIATSCNYVFLAKNKDEALGQLNKLGIAHLQNTRVNLNLYELTWLNGI